MKKTMFMLIAVVFSLAVSAQKLKEADVPSPVKDAFKKNHSAAKEIKWEKEGGNFEVEFKIGKTEQSELMDATGQILETEVEIKTAELPAAAREYVVKHYKNAKIREASKITAADGNVTYEAEVHDTDLIFDSKGTFIRAEAEKKEDKE